MLESIAGIAVALGALGAAAPDADAAGVDFFEKRIRPVLVERCYACHSAGARKVRAELYLDSREGILQGGESGPAVVPGEPEKSLLIKAIRHDDGDLEMPPKDEERLSDAQVADFVAWVKMGAPDPRRAEARAASAVVGPAVDFVRAREHWSYRPIADPPLPEVKDPDWCRSPIDRFILSGIEAKGLSPASDAGRRTLIRRAAFDLTGLPPAPEEIDTFLADESPGAFSKVVERLLASPHYGERWGRHWLDLVRYADTAGDNSDYPVPQLYLYRNYVIDSFNRDTPYDRFLRQQLAGDLLPAAGETERRENLIATGYIALARRFGSQINGYPQHLTIEDTIDNLGRAFLGLTVSCARCHDHKFDAVTSEDYYALYGVFHSTRYPFPGIELDKVPRDLVALAPAAEVEAWLRPHREKLAVLSEAVKRLEEEKEALQKAVREAEEGAGEKSGELLAKAGEARKQIDELKRKIKEAIREREDFEKSLPEIESAYAVAEAAKVEDARLQVRGDPKTPGKEVPRRFLEVLGGMRLPEGARGSGRLELAGWLTDPGNPLVARVMANRIWSWHFGKGLVRTPSDFGVRGEPPTHPELLDWLARRFVEGGWSPKALHRLILGSRTYGLAGSSGPESAGADPENLALSRFPRRRLEAEAIRDAILAASGGLDRTQGGPHPFPPRKSWGFTQHKPFTAVYETRRRSVYLMTQRWKKHPFLELFDGADTNASTAERGASVTALQALFLMNDPFVHEEARRFAERLLAERTEDAARLERAYLLALGRPPAPDEAEAGLSHLEEVRRRLERAGIPAEERPLKAWESLARVIFRTNEFIHVD